MYIKGPVQLRWSHQINCNSDVVDRDDDNDNDK